MKRVCFWGGFHMTAESPKEPFWNWCDVNGFIPWTCETFGSRLVARVQGRYSIYCENKIMQLKYLTHVKNSLNNGSLIMLFS